MYGDTDLAEPITGQWKLDSFPDTVFLNGKYFHRAVWKQAYPNVVEQYREIAPIRSAHLKIRTDGTWIIDHIDDYNPDTGSLIGHFFFDLPLGQFIGVVGLAIGAEYLIKRLLR